MEQGYNMQHTFQVCLGMKLICYTSWSKVFIYQFGLLLEESGTRLHVYVKQTAQEEGIKEGWE